jgi:cell division protein FtsI/penicillin-binding protein 2
MRKKSELLFEEFATDAYGKSEVDYVEVPVSVNIFTVVGICAAAALLILFGRMVYLGGFEGSFYSARAQRNINSEQPIPAQRGVIPGRLR